MMKRSPFISAQVQVKPGKRYLLKLATNKHVQPALKIAASKDTLVQTMKYVSDTVSYSVLDVKQSAFIGLHDPYNTVREFLIIESDYTPDFYSEKFNSYEFKKLPYIWGTYDKEQPKEPVLYQHSSNAVLSTTSPFLFSIPAKLDKSSGNTLVFTCTNTSGKPQLVNLAIGNDREWSKTNLTFFIMPSDKEERYAIRISSIYKWYSGNINRASLHLFGDRNITVNNIQITKGG
jgi:hypothetical protein